MAPIVMRRPKFAEQEAGRVMDTARFCVPRAGRRVAARLWIVVLGWIARYEVQMHVAGSSYIAARICGTGLPVGLGLALPAGVNVPRAAIATAYRFAKTPCAGRISCMGQIPPARARRQNERAPVQKLFRFAVKAGC